MHWAWGWSKCIVEKVFQWVCPYKIKYPANDVDAVPSSSLPRSCSPVKSWKGLFDQVTSLFSLGPNNKSSALPIVPLLHNPALSPGIRDRAQTLQMKLNLTTNAKTVLPLLVLVCFFFLRYCLFHYYFTSTQNKTQIMHWHPLQPLYSDY